MKNKRGFLLAEETLKIVIAVISIGFLIYFLTALYMSNRDSKDLELAKASLQHLVDEINDGRESIEIYNPETSWSTHWGLFIWPYGGDSIKPKTCENLGWEKCICICGITLGTLKKQATSEGCDKLGACLEFHSNLEINNPSWLNTDYAIELENIPLNLKINYVNNKITK